MENQWLAHAKRLQAMASTGLSYSKDDFDRERFREIADIAQAMLSQLASVPIERIAELVPAFARGYLTPSVDVRGAVMDDERILLVRERSDGLWTLPGGFADIGLSAAENVVKEIREEAGLSVTVRSLYAVRHKAKGGYDPDARDFYKLYFLCDRIDSLEPHAGPEISQVGYFPRDGLPELSRDRVVERDIEDAFAFRKGSMRLTAFD